MKVPSFSLFVPSPVLLAVFLFLSASLLFFVNAYAEELSVPAGSDSVFAGGPDAPVLSGSEGVDVWLKSGTSTIFTWSLPDDVTAVAVSVATTSGKEPSKSYRPPISEFPVDTTLLDDGIYYLAVQFKNDVKWGRIAEQILRVDNTPPESFSISVESANDDGGFVMSLNAVDMLSGVDHYEINAGERPPLNVTADYAARGFVIVPDRSGDYLIRVRAVDKAGNYRDESVTVLVGNTEILRRQNQELHDRQLQISGLIGLLTFLILTLLMFLVYERKRYNRRIIAVKVETEEIHTQLVRIFNALRDEIHDQIRSITKRPKLSKAEKEAVEGLQNALDISETLIDKEIADVKKIVK